MTADPIRLVALLAVAMLVAIVARRFSLPYTVGLVLAGIGIAVAGVNVGGALTHDFIFYVILPPLLFEAALALRWRDLFDDAGIIFVLATLGTMLAAGVVAFGAYTLLHWPPATACIFGTLIAATDPVAVIAMFKDNGVGGRLRTLMESESLFNDAAAAILFSLALSFAMVGGPASVGAAGLHLGFEILGGAAIGGLCGGLALLLAGRARDHTVEIALTVLAAYGSFLAADQVGASGILATVVAGLVIGSAGVRSQRPFITAKGKQFAGEFWDFAAFMANSTVFPLIGVAVGAATFSSAALVTIAIAIALVLLGRALTIYPLSLLFAASKRKVPMAYQHILWWGGLRGALALALALALPAALPHRLEIVLTTFGVVAFSIVAQGLTMPWLMRRLAIL